MTRQHALGLGLALSLGLLTGSLFDDATQTAADPTAPAQSALVTREGADLDVGSFSISRTGVAHPVQWTWVQDQGNGTYQHTVVLFLVNDATDGYLYPGSDHTDLTFDVSFLGDPQHTDEGAFLQWVEDRYTANFPSLGADKDTDFTVDSYTTTGP